MIIYEVNLRIQPAIFDDYYQWLLEHIREMLKVAGFIKAELGLVVDEPGATDKRLRVAYLVESIEMLEAYFNNQASSMRADAIKKFGDQFTATRRIIAETHSFV